MDNFAFQHCLEEFADCSDKLFELKVIRADNFTGEIGEYIVSRYFNLELAQRSNEAYDAIDSNGYKYQIKSKIRSGNNYNYHINGLKYDQFDFLVVVYFDEYYTPILILRIPAKEIHDKVLNINESHIHSYNQDISKLNLPKSQQLAIRKFADVYLKLVDSEIIRSRRIVGDIGEYYACQLLNLERCICKNTKGMDASGCGLTFEIKTRRVYESDRRVSQTRRLNNLVGKDADYLIVVTIDRTFRCSGMWIMPMENIINLKSANLNIVNNGIGVKNLIPSKVDWLNTGEPFISF
ncbi:MAG: hypothetical protein GX416_10535 [Bacteroidales bacterium]|nr:hypothetical protein [Bacteroidales bacterium]